jgi:DNA-binding response OmpR family regulator
MGGLENKKIIIAEDEPELAQIYADFLRRDGAKVTIAANGKIAIDEARRLSPDLMLLDIAMPIKDGLSALVACRELDPDLPVIMLTALGDDLDKLTGFRLGADDYVVKPCNPLEVVARAQAVLRRKDKSGGANSGGSFDVGQVRLESLSRRAWVGDALLTLTPSEFRILEALMARVGRLLTRAWLAEEILALETADRSIDAHVSRLRAKINMASDVRITSVRGEGYRLDHIL